MHVGKRHETLTRQGLAGLDRLSVVGQKVFAVAYDLDLYEVAAAKLAREPCDPQRLLGVSCAAGIRQQRDAARDEIQDIAALAFVHAAQRKRDDLAARVPHAGVDHRVIELARAHYQARAKLPAT